MCELQVIGGNSNIEVSTSPNINLEELCQEFIDFLDVNSDSMNIYASHLRKFMNYVKDRGVTVGNITRKFLIDYREHLLKCGFKPNYINVGITAVRMFFRFLYSKQYIKTDITINVKRLPIADEFLRDALTEKQLIKVLDSIDMSKPTGLRNKLIILLLSTTGMRRSELRNIRYCDIQTIDGQKVIFIKIKGFRSRDHFVKIGEYTESVLNEYIRINKFDTKKDLLLFDLSRNYLSLVIRNILTENKLDSPRLTLHSFRHTAATNCLLHGMSLESVRNKLQESNSEESEDYEALLKRKRGRKIIK